MVHSVHFLIHVLHTQRAALVIRKCKGYETVFTHEREHERGNYLPQLRSAHSRMHSRIHVHGHAKTSALIACSPARSTSDSAWTHSSHTAVPLPDRFSCPVSS